MKKICIVLVLCSFIPFTALCMEVATKIVNEYDQQVKKKVSEFVKQIENNGVPFKEIKERLAQGSISSEVVKFINEELIKKSFFDNKVIQKIKKTEADLSLDFVIINYYSSNNYGKIQPPFSLRYVEKKNENGVTQLLKDRWYLDAFSFVITDVLPTEKLIVKNMTNKKQMLVNLDNMTCSDLKSESVYCFGSDGKVHGCNGTDIFEEFSNKPPIKVNLQNETFVDIAYGQNNMNSTYDCIAVATQTIIAIKQRTDNDFLYIKKEDIKWEGYIKKIILCNSLGKQLYIVTQSEDGEFLYIYDVKEKKLCLLLEKKDEIKVVSSTRDGVILASYKTLEGEDSWELYYYAWKTKKHLIEELSYKPTIWVNNDVFFIFDSSSRSYTTIQSSDVADVMNYFDVDSNSLTHCLALVYIYRFFQNAQNAQDGKGFMPDDQDIADIKIVCRNDIPQSIKLLFGDTFIDTKDKDSGGKLSFKSVLLELKQNIFKRSIYKVLIVTVLAVAGCMLYKWVSKK